MSTVILCLHGARTEPTSIGNRRDCDVLLVSVAQRKLSDGMSHHGPLAHPRSMKIGYHTRAAARATSYCLGTTESVMSLTWELSAPRIVAFKHAEQSRVQESSLPGRGHTRRDGPVDRVMLLAVFSIQTP